MARARRTAGIVKHHYAPEPTVLDLAVRAATGLRRVLEVGGGNTPFPPATEHVDWGAWPALAGKTVHRVDLNKEALPFDDKSFDFVYCRHTLEDLYNPGFACAELRRVARAGYIETPSPVAECCTGTQGGSPWRGYSHHRYLIWPEGRTLKILPKYPLVEHLPLNDRPLVDVLNAGPIYWNSYFWWRGTFSIELLEHDVQFHIHPDYRRLVERSIQRSVTNSNRVARILGGRKPWRDKVRALTG